MGRGRVPPGGHHGRRRVRRDFPQPEKLWTIADLGGWKQVDSTLFKKDVGSIAKIYDAATQ